MKIGQDIFVQQGILDYQITQLIDYSQTDPDIKKFTSDSKRFADKNAFSQWQQQGRIIYTLTDIHHNLLGLIWFGQKDPPIKINASFTFAIRIYSLARGQGLSQEFMKLTFADLFKNKKNAPLTGFWLETSVQNTAAIHVYQKFGFKTVGQQNDRLIMVL